MLCIITCLTAIACLPMTDHYDILLSKDEVKKNRLCMSMLDGINETEIDEEYYTHAYAEVLKDVVLNNLFWAGQRHYRIKLNNGYLSVRMAAMSFMDDDEHPHSIDMDRKEYVREFIKGMNNRRVIGDVDMMTDCMTSLIDVWLNENRHYNVVVLVVATRVIR